MITNTDYKFEVSLSEKGYNHKPDRNNEIPYLHFTKKTVDVDDFLEFMLEGYCYTGVYSYDSFDIGQKDNDNYRYSYLVTIDVDHSTETMNELVDRIEFKPTFAYTSCRDGLNGESRFRLVYAFDDKIEGKEEYYNLVYSILIANGVDIEKEVGYKDKKYDKKSEDAIQFYIGNGTETFDFTVTDIIYCKEDFNLYYKDYYIRYNTCNNINNKLYNKSINITHIPTHPTIMSYDDTFENEEFKKDYWSMRMEDILIKYLDTFPNMEHTPLPMVSDDTPYILFPKDYTEIRRYWTCKDDGRAIKLKDGQGRRHKLFINGIIRRLINPNINFDNLLYNLLYELVYYISNYQAENTIDKREIFQITRNVMKEDITRYEGLRGTDRKFMVNQRFCEKYALSKKKVRVIAANAIMSNKIGELYDCSLTDKQNLEVMKEHGLVISPTTLKRWRKLNGITIYKKKAK